MFIYFCHATKGQKGDPSDPPRKIVGRTGMTELVDDDDAKEHDHLRKMGRHDGHGDDDPKEGVDIKFPKHG